jgi:SNF2 family DNA or RNA helicase
MLGVRCSKQGTLCTICAAAENQATDRAHRIGQQSTVFVHKLICEGTIEERILELQKKKAALVSSLLSGSATSLAAMDASDLEFLLAPVQ